MPPLATQRLLSSAIASQSQPNVHPLDVVQSTIFGDKMPNLEFMAHISITFWQRIHGVADSLVVRSCLPLGFRLGVVFVSNLL